MSAAPTSADAAFESAVARHFPGRPPGIAYFDTAAIGFVPEAARASASACYAALGQGTAGSGSWRPRVEHAHESLAAEFGVARDEVAFMASTSEAMIGIARLISWQPEDEVLVSEGDFPAAVWPWLDLDLDPGATMRVRQIAPAEDDDRLTPLLAAITPRTRVVSVTHVNSTTGTRMDLDALGRACHAVGALLVVDGAQAGGCIPPQLDHVDFYLCTGYKWMLAGFGVAAVIGRRDALGRLGPSRLGDGGAPASPHLTYGHLNLPGICAFDAAAAVRHEIGLEAIQDRVSVLATRIHQESLALGLHPVAPLARTAALICLDGLADASAAAARLAEQGIRVAVRNGRLRISPNFYNTAAELDVLLRGLSAIATEPTTRTDN